MRNFVIALLLSLTALPATARTIEGPNDFQIDAVYRHLSGTTPNYENSARASEAYRSASEFDRTEVLNQQIELLKAEFEAVADVDAFVIRTRAQISEYDSANGAFYITAFEPGTYFPFGGIDLTMENAEEFRSWSLSVDEARDIRETVSRFAPVTAEIKIRAFGALQSGGHQIRGQVIGVKLFHDSKLIYEKELPEEAYQPISAGGGSSDEKVIPQDQLVTSDLQLGQYLEPLETTLFQNGYSFFEGVSRGEEYAYRPLGFSTDEATLQRFRRSAESRAAVIESNIMQGRNGPHYLTAVLGPELDCRGTSDALEKCGYLFVRDTGEVESIIHMQQALGASEDTIIDALTERYGPPSDKLPAIILGAYRGTMLVWGTSSRDLGKTVPAISDVSENRHWQIEAYITEPEAGRRAAIVQLNTITASATGEADGAKIEF